MTSPSLSQNGIQKVPELLSSPPNPKPVKDLHSRRKGVFLIDSNHAILELNNYIAHTTDSLPMVRLRPLFHLFEHPFSFVVKNFISNFL